MEGDGLKDGFAALDQVFLQSIHGQYVGQVAFVELQDVGDFVEVVAVLFEVLDEVVEGFDVGVHAFFLGVCDEDDAVDAAQDEFTASVVKHLAGNGIEVEPGFEAADRAEIEGQEVEEEGSIGLGRQRDHLAFLFFRGFVINALQVRRFTAQTRAVIDDFAVNLAGGEIDKTQKNPQ